MRIEKVFVNGFGQLKDRDFDFGPQINIVYGENEKGKSTLHNFIENMLYHSYKTGMKTRKATGLIDKYKPWGSSKYSGALTVFDGETRRIEKDFSAPTKIKISIHDKTGVEVSDSYDFDSVFKEAKFGARHFGLSKVMFKNTVSIGQMDKSTDKEASTEIKKYVSNIEDAKDATISVHDVLEKIKKEKDDIGKKTRSKTRYAIRDKRIKELEAELKASLEVVDEIDSLQIDLVRAKAEKEDVEDRLALINTRLVDIENFENNELKKKADEIVVGINDTNKELSYLKKYENFTYDKISELGKIKADIEKVEISNASIQNEITRLENEKSGLLGKTNLKSNIYELLAKKSDFKDGISTIRGLEGRNEEIKRELLHSIDKVATLNEEKEPNKHVALIVILLTLLVGFGVMFFNNYVGLAIIVGGLAGVGLYWQRQKEKYKIYSIKSQKDKAEVEELEKSLAENEENIKKIYETTECETMEEMEAKLDDISGQIAVLTEKADVAKQNREKLSGIESELVNKKAVLDDGKARASRLYERRDSIFANLDIDSFDNTEEGYLKNKRFDEVKQENDNLKQRLEELLLGKNYDDLELKKVVSKNVNVEEKVALLEEKERINKEFIETTKSEEKIVEKISSLERSVRSIQSFEEEIELLKAEKAEDDRRIKVLNLLEEKINATIDTVQRTVMPEVNTVIGDIVKNVTDNRYDDVKVSGDLEVYVTDKENNKIVEIDSLSAGTIDLLYVGLRIGMAGLFNNNKPVPIFFDDTFAQIDDKRLKNLLQYLASLDRQIFIFTCHMREDEILNELGVEHNLIRL